MLIMNPLCTVRLVMESYKAQWLDQVLHMLPQSTVKNVTVMWKPQPHLSMEPEETSQSSLDYCASFFEAFPEVDDLVLYI